MLTNNLGYPRIGSHRELKKACEQYWSGKTTQRELLQVGKQIRLHNWQLQKSAGIDLIPSNDFSFYDQVLDMSLTVGAIPSVYNQIILDRENTELDLYFGMARGYQQKGLDITAMEMTKWFDTNYHYIVPEFYKNQQFTFFSRKVVDEFYEAKQAGMLTKPVLIGPISYLLLGKEKEAGFHRIELLENLLPVYFEILNELKNNGVEWVQFDEPFLALDLSDKEKKYFKSVYKQIRSKFPGIQILVASYFEGLRDNIDLACSLPVDALHIDLVKDPAQLNDVLVSLPDTTKLSLGVVDGRNIWKNDYASSLAQIQQVVDKIGDERVLVAASCSLLHSPCDLELETNDSILVPEIKQWLAFAKQKVYEIVSLKKLATETADEGLKKEFMNNQHATNSRKTSSLIHDRAVKEREKRVESTEFQRASRFDIRKEKQREVLNLPLFPTTTIGSFPQTRDIRAQRALFKKGHINLEEYERALKLETEKAIRWQDEIDLDVLVHGEFERNDMVEYFGEQLNGFVFTKNGWVQSYGSRCVKPPIIYGDISRQKPMTIAWTQYAQNLTNKLVKGMLTGPVTILQWSFVRDDQPRSATCNQIALAIRDEVEDLEAAGIKVIQIDEPAIREGLPLRKSKWQAYLHWAIKAFRIASTGVKDETQIHTHMCYSEFNDIIQHIAEMDADVITIECSRSKMELLDAFISFAYPQQIGPGVYDIHSPRIPLKEEMVGLLTRASEVIPSDQIWVNPDCGLKTRNWEETQKALVEMVGAAKSMRLAKAEPMSV
ncbi:5-methyltetrahydropteroyltriglutamate--homocysteine S-methyltransferase [Albibacterium profundi]|uniref:5-methyltetrahydropteroyltriglutamate--homocysteine methyltransferase n=1 Tax=Albibacterium profundi TaxID=3134906 RepID=A0ABV5CCS2_9SPHI